MKRFKGFRADRLREAMKKNKVTFEEIADVVVTAQKVWWSRDKRNIKYHSLDIIDGEAVPSINELFVICKTVNVSADYLLGLSDKMY